MGAGIAVGFKERYPEMYKQYRRLCKANPRQFNLGDAFLWKEKGKPLVFNLATQEQYWRGRASYEAVEKALETMRYQADEKGITSIAMPRMGPVMEAYLGKRFDLSSTECLRIGLEQLSFMKNSFLKTEIG